MELGADRVLAARCDVTSWASQRDLNRIAVENFAGLDAVVANAGIGGGHSFLGDDPDLWREILMTNVLGVAMTIKANLPTVIERRGQLVLIGSTAGLRAEAGSMYSCSKCAVTAMAESLRQEVRGLGVRVSLVSPSNTATAFFASPPERSLRPERVAGAVMSCLNQHRSR